MNLKRKLLQESRLYVIIDKEALKRVRPLINAAGNIMEAGADVIQYRDKISDKETVLENALLLRKILKNSKTLFIVNDYLDIAKITDSDGIHLGQDDLPIELARRILGKDKIIGISCHNLKEAVSAQNKGADYISMGPVFATLTKPNLKPLGLGLINEAAKIIRIPFFAIGGINKSNISEVLTFGAKRVAVCRAVCQAKDISSLTTRFINFLGYRKV
jgi:thiamine-phosphate pyrophosphorylase